MELWQILLLVGVAVLMAVVGFALGVIYRKKVGEKLIKSAETEAERIVEDAKKQGETKKKEALLEAKEEALRIKNETERELKERRNDLNRIERRTIQKEETLDKKIENQDVLSFFSFAS